MNRNIKIIQFSFLLFVGIKAQAQTPQKISLQQAIDMSIANSNSLKIASAKIMDASANVQEAKDRQLPDAKVNASYLRLAGAKLDLKNSQAGNGGPKVNQALYALVNVSMPIYAGGKIKYGIEAAKYLEEAAKLGVENDKQGITFNTIAAYTNLYKAGAVVYVLHENLKTAEQRDATFGRLEQNGLLARNDLLKAQLQTSNIELSLLDAENNFNLAKINMAIMLGLPENSNIELDSSFVNAKQDLQPFLDYENLALQNRKDIKIIGIQKKANGIGIKAAKADAYPTVALTGGYINADIPKTLSLTNALNIGVGVQYNIANLWKSNTKLAQAKAREVQLTASENMLTDGIRLQVNRDYQNCLLAKKKIDVYEKAIAQATENARITKNKYDNSLVSITELLEANDALLQTKLVVAAAKADAALAYHKLLETTGTSAK
jgi:outer membrane protein